MLNSDALLNVMQRHWIMSKFAHLGSNIASLSWGLQLCMAGYTVANPDIMIATFHHDVGVCNSVSQDTLLQTPTS